MFPPFPPPGSLLQGFGAFGGVPQLCLCQVVFWLGRQTWIQKPWANPPRTFFGGKKNTSPPKDERIEPEGNDGWGSMIFRYHGVSDEDFSM